MLRLFIRREEEEKTSIRSDLDGIARTDFRPLYLRVRGKKKNSAALISVMFGGCHLKFKVHR